MNRFKVTYHYLEDEEDNKLEYDGIVKWADPQQHYMSFNAKSFAEAERICEDSLPKDAVVSSIEVIR